MYLLTYIRKHTHTHTHTHKLRGARTRRFITALTASRHRSLSWASRITSITHPPPPANLPKIDSDPILPTTPWSSEWSLSFGLPPHTLTHLTIKMFLWTTLHLYRPQNVVTVVRQWHAPRVKTIKYTQHFDGETFSNMVTWKITGDVDVRFQGLRRLQSNT
jgi:hypothetical protein